MLHTGFVKKIDNHAIAFSFYENPVNMNSFFEIKWVLQISFDLLDEAHDKLENNLVD